MPVDILSQPPVPASGRVHYGKDPAQFYDVFGVPGNGAMVIMIHGGFWRAKYDLTHASHLCAALAQTGVFVVSLEYRRDGWPMAFEDVKAGFSAAAKSELPVVLGHSAGGQLALLLASEKLAMKGVVGLAPVACMERAYEEDLGASAVADFLGGKPSEIPAIYADADPVKHPATIRRVLVHGTEDDTVPLSNSRCYVEARHADPGGVRLVEVAGAEHLDLIDPSSHAWPMVLANVKQLLA